MKSNRYLTLILILIISACVFYSCSSGSETKTSTEAATDSVITTGGVMEVNVTLSSTAITGGDLLIEPDQYNMEIACEFCPDHSMFAKTETTEGSTEVSVIFTCMPSDSTAGGGEITGRVSLDAEALSGPILYHFIP